MLGTFLLGVARLPIHDLVKPLEWLIGTWRCEMAHGSYPTIADFTYGEELSFWNVGQPMLNFSTFSWHVEKKNPMHQEFGFLRIKPQTKDVSLVVTHNFGVTSIEDGQIAEKELRLTSSNIGRMAFAKEPGVLKLVREFTLNENGSLKQRVSMETTKTPMTQHLEAVYVKA